MLGSLTIPFWSPEPPVVVEESKAVPSLPTELWGMIIDILVDQIRRPYWYCNPETFPQYQARLSAESGPEDDPALEDWKTIRFVCKAWKWLAGPSPHMYITRSDFESPTKESIFGGASSVILHCNVDGQLLRDNLLRDPNLTFKLTTIIFSEDRQWHGIDLLLDMPSAFPNLRALSLLSNASRRRFWRGLTKGYPLLVSLTIRFHVEDDMGSYIMNNLETLDMSTWDRFRLSCPSLKHLSIRHGYTSTMFEFLNKHGHQLESILIENGYPLDDQFWTMFPNIRTLGKSFYIKPISNPPPVTHPLRHLRLFSQRQKLRTDTILLEIGSLPAVTHVHIRPGDLSVGVLEDTFEDVRARCQQKNVEVVKVQDLKQYTPPDSPPSFSSLLTSVWQYLNTGTARAK
ncbi:hypothetical protein FRC17_008157 [Serendipita sp. 399]|nr:hypothetical protein FRC17_008157 [Serendipita sp. 399]